MPIAMRIQIREVLVRVLDELEEETPDFGPFITELRRTPNFERFSVLVGERLFGLADVGTGAETGEREDERRV